MTDTPPGAPAPMRLYTLPEVSETTALSASTLRREIRLKRLAVHRFGAKGSVLRIREDDLAAWLARHRRAAR
jgi:excisionase family DNA binding protein